MLTNETTSRHLRWETCFNVRDLGGLPTADGGVTRFGAVVRADSLSRLNDRGCAALEAYGVRTIIDMRASVEVRDDPSPLIGHSLITTHHLALDPYEPSYNRSLGAHQEMGMPHMAAVKAAFLATHRAQIATIVQTVAEAPEGGVLFHCAAGRDRTGLMAALILAVANVPAPTIVADYILSFSTSAETMEATLSHLEITEGGVEEFLVNAGVPPSAIVRLRQRLRGD